MQRPLSFCGFPLLALALASCGAPGPEPSAVAPEAEMAAGHESGTIIGLRPLGQASSPAMAQVLAQVLRVATGPGVATPSNATELVVRLERGGRDVALVQEAGLRLGQRVTLTSGARPMLLPAVGGT